MTPNVVEADAALVPHVLKALRVMHIPECGLLVWLDTEYGRDLLASLGDLFRLRGLFWPVELGNPVVPEKVVKRVAADGHAYVVWIAKEDVAGPVELLTATIAHEFRHLEQRLFSKDLYYAGSLIFVYLRWRSASGEAHKATESPLEWDAEARAREVAAQIHGESAVHAQYQRAKSFQFLNQLPVSPLPGLAVTIRHYLVREQVTIRQLVQDVGPVGGDARDLFDLVDWPAFGLQHFAASVSG